MGKLINLIIAAVIFWVVYFYLVPLLPAPAAGFVGVIVVIIAIVYLLGELSGFNWPWNK
jgi:hypothetical protein